MYELNDMIIRECWSTYRGGAAAITLYSTTTTMTTAACNACCTICIIAITAAIDHVVVVVVVVGSADCAALVDASAHHREVVRGVGYGDHAVPIVYICICDWFFQVFRGDAVVVMQHHSHVLLA